MDSLGSEASGESTARGLWLAATLIAGALLGFFKIGDPDVYWHLKTGQVILETGRLVRVNLFCAGHPDYPWHNLEWLHQVVLAAAYNLGGWPGVAVFKTLLVLATLAVVYATLLRRAPKPALAAAVTLVVLAAIRFRLTERPHLFSHLFMALTVWVVERSRRDGGRVIWALPPLFALWSNIHPELILGLAYLGASAAGDWIDGRRGAALPVGAVRRHFTVLALSALATLANPETYRVVATPLSLLSGADPAGLINEFRRSSFGTEPLFWLLAGAALLAMIAARENRRWSAILPLVCLCAAGAAYVRAVSAFALAAAPVVHVALCGALDQGGLLGRRLARSAAVAGAVGAIGWALLFDRMIPYRWGYGPDEQIVPEGAARFVLANDLPPNLYNPYNEGGYLIYRLYPRWRVFQDGRGASPPEFAAALQQPRGEGLLRLLAEQQVSTAVVPTVEIGVFGLLGDWGVVFWDDAFAVLVRRSPATGPLLSRLEYRAFLPNRSFPSDTEGLVATYREMRRNREERLLPSLQLALRTGEVLARLGRPELADLEIARALAIAPEKPDAWSALAALRRAQGRTAEAAAAEAAAEARRGRPGLLAAVKSHLLR